MERDVNRVVEQLRAATRDMAAVTASADSDDGLVAVTVNGGGVLVDLDLDPRIYREHDSRALAERILAAVSEAQELAMRKATSVVERLGKAV